MTYGQCGELVGITVDRPMLVRLGADLSAAFVYARDHGPRDDLYQLLSMTNGVFDGEPIFPVIVPDGERIRPADPRTGKVPRLHEKIIPTLRFQYPWSSWRVSRSALPGYDEADQSWPLHPGMAEAAFFDLQLKYTP